MSGGNAEKSGLSDRWLRVLEPKTVVVVGASEDNYYSRSIVKNLETHQYEGSICFVNPKKSSVFGRNCVPSILDVPDPDVVVLCVNRTQVEGVIDDAIKADVAASIILANGFRDSGRAEWIETEERIKKKANSAGMIGVGPNTLGLISTANNSYLFTTPTQRILPGNVAIIVQSGGLVGTSARYLNILGTGLRYAVGIGNGSITTAAEWLDALSSDESVSTVGLLLESIYDWTDFRAAAEKAIENGKDIVVCKTGRTSLGQSVAYSHTGALATDYAIQRDAFDQIGVRVSDSVNELVMTVSLFSRFGKPKMKTLGVMGQSGGGNGQIADQCGEAGIELPELTADTVATIQDGGRYVAKGNPLDLADHAMTDLDAYSSAVEAFIKDPNLGAILFAATLDFDSPIHCDCLQRVQRAAAKVGKPLVAVPVCYTEIANPGVLGFASPDGASIIAPVIDHVISGLRVWLGANPTMGATSIVSESAGGKTQWRNEHQLKEMLRSQDARIPKSVWLEADTLSDPSGLRLLGDKVVIKGIGLDIHHKSRLGLVELDVKIGIGSIGESCARIRLAAATAGVRLDGLLVEEAIEGSLDLILGLSQQQVGLVLLIGNGGVNVERDQSVKFSVLPVSDSRLDQVFRDAGVTDKAAVAGCVDLVRCLEKFFIENRLNELECNPVRVDARGKAWVLDALALA